MRILYHQLDIIRTKPYNRDTMDTAITNICTYNIETYIHDLIESPSRVLRNQTKTLILESLNITSKHSTLARIWIGIECRH
jgi:hypothetical protein